MSLPKPLHEDHEVLGDDYCPGYVDAYGNWANGFPCPALSPTDPPVFCCGTTTHKYCCTGDGVAATNTGDNASADSPVANLWVDRLPLLLGVLVGAMVAVTVVVVVSCLHCSCCLLYKKRQPSNTGPMYQLQGGTTGVANMYSFSRTTTPQCSLSRSSSLRSGTSSDSNRHSVSSVRGMYATEPQRGPVVMPSAAPGGGGIGSSSSPFAPHFTHFPTTMSSRHTQHHHAPRSDCGSLISSLTSSATASDGTNRDGSISNGRIPCGPPSNQPITPTDDISGSMADLPPPYSLTPSSNHTPVPPPSTLVAVRTSGTQGTAAASAHSAANNPRQLTNSGGVATSGNRAVANSRLNGDVFVIGTGENGCVTGMFSTFTQSPTSPSTTMTASIRPNPSSASVRHCAEESPFFAGVNNRAHGILNRSSSSCFNNNEHYNLNNNNAYNANFSNGSNFSDSDGVGSAHRYGSAQDHLEGHRLVSYAGTDHGHREPTDYTNNSNQTSLGSNYKLPGNNQQTMNHANIHGTDNSRGNHFSHDHTQTSNFIHQDKSSQAYYPHENRQNCTASPSNEGCQLPFKNRGQAPPSAFSPALTPTTRPCSTAHIIHTAQNAEDGSGPTEQEVRLLTATKF